MKRFDAHKVITESLSDQLLVTGSFGPAMWELYHLKDRDENFYMFHSMGLATSIALGLALAQPNRKVIAIEGDGGILMNLNSFATIGFANPKNLVLIAVDNGRHDTTGGQPTATSISTDLEKVAKATGFAYTAKVQTPEELREAFNEALNRNELSMIHIIVEPGAAKVPEMNLDPVEIKFRFRKRLLGLA